MHFRCLQCDFIGDFAHELLDHMAREDHAEDCSVRCPNSKWNVASSDIEGHYKECVALKTNVKCLRCEEYQGCHSKAMKMFC